MQTQRLTIKQTATGYWVVQRGQTHLAGAMTRKAAEAERDLLGCLRDRQLRRGERGASGAQPAARQPGL